MKKNCSSSKGFTLVELLVVVAIIAILAVVGAVVYQGQIKNARNAARRADIEAIANAMEANKTAASINYTALAGTFFTSGSVPTDQTDTNEAPDSACPGVCKYCVRASAGACTIADTPVADGAPGAVSTWTVCANLEGGSYFCKTNSQ